MAIQTEMIPMPLEAGAEMAALARFHRDVTWTGTIEPNAFGPGSPPMTAVGEGVHRFIQDGLWIVGDHRQDQFLADGTFVARWQLHWVAGWDPQAKEYRATVADNYGHAEVLRGRIDGDLLTFTPRRLSTSARGAEAIMTTDVSHRVEKLPAASTLGDDDEAPPGLAGRPSHPRRRRAAGPRRDGQTPRSRRARRGERARRDLSAAGRAGRRRPDRSASPGRSTACWA